MIFLERKRAREHGFYRKCPSKNRGGHAKDIRFRFVCAFFLFFLIAMKQKGPPEDHRAAVTIQSATSQIVAHRRFIVAIGICTVASRVPSV